ncbi:MAG: hypothetical protein WB245_07780 [Acidimicrobiia bacterium]
MRRRALIVAGSMGVLLMAATALARGIEAGPQDLERLHEFERESGLDVGPDTEWFANGLSGDGAVYAIMATDPFGSAQGALILDPSYRYARVGYSWVSSALVLGRRSLILMGLSFTGLICVGLVTFMAAGLRDQLGLKTWLLVLNPALFIGALYDTAEPLAIVLLVAGFVAGLRLCSLALAVVRPTYAVAVANRPATFVAVIVLSILFRLVWVAHFGDSIMGGASNLAFPFTGVASSPNPVGFAVLVAGLVTLIGGIRARSWSWLAAGLLVCCLGGPVYADPINAVRAAGMLPVLWAFGTHPELRAISGPGTTQIVANPSV